MSNLGLYQEITRISKKMHGPQNFIAALVIGGGAIGWGMNSLATMVSTKVKKTRAEKKKAVLASQVYSVVKEGRSNEGLLFNVGDTFHVLEQDGDAALIEISGNQHNPYFVSANFLYSISNFGGEPC